MLNNYCLVNFLIEHELIIQAYAGLTQLQGFRTPEAMLAHFNSCNMAKFATNTPNWSNDHVLDTWLFELGLQIYSHTKIAPNSMLMIARHLLMAPNRIIIVTTLIRMTNIIGYKQIFIDNRWFCI